MLDDVTLTDVISAVASHSRTAHPLSLVNRVCIDSRETRPGDLFWAIRGEQHDGHEFVLDAISAGATACVVDRPLTLPDDVSAIEVADTLVALQDFATWHLDRHDPYVIGVTGSAGKTTTRSMTYAVLSAEFAGRQSPRNFNNHIGLPLTLLGIGPSDEFLVCEMGASAVGEIAALSKLARPEVGIITSVGPAHLEGFGSLAGVCQGKGELFDALPANGLAVLAGDDPLARSLAGRAKCRTILVGTGAENMLRAKDVAVLPEGLSFRVNRQVFRLPIQGRHHVNNAMCAIAVGLEVGITPQRIAKTLAEFQPVEGRTEARPVGPWHVIDDTYNANPLSMSAACQLLTDLKLTARRRIAVFGDMVELGRESRGFHCTLGAEAAATGVDLLLAYGDHSKDVVAGALAEGMSPYRIAECNDMRSLLAVLDCWLEPGDTVLVKGSRRLQMERVVTWLDEQAASIEVAFNAARQLRTCA